MVYIMVDVESDGPIPGDYSMVCFGAIVVEPALDRTFYGRLKLPPAFWHWPDLCRALMGPWGRALALGFGLVMCLAALLEVWELVDRLLVRFMGESEH